MARKDKGRLIKRDTLSRSGRIYRKDSGMREWKKMRSKRVWMFKELKFSKQFLLAKNKVHFMLGIINRRIYKSKYK